MPNKENHNFACQRCERVNPGAGTFCIFCGAPLIDIFKPKDNLSKKDLTQGQVSSDSESLQDIRNVLIGLTSRVSRLESLQGGASFAAPDLSRTATTPSTEDGAPNFTTSNSPPATDPGVRLVNMESGRRDSSSSWWSRMRYVDWDRVLGMNWLAIIGAVALTIGIGFFMKLTIDNEWINETGQISIGIVAGIVLLFAGEYSRRKYPFWAQAVTGGGIAILYLAIYATFGFYEVIPPILGLIFLAAIVAMSGVLSIRYDSLVIALLGIFGAFLTPVLLGAILTPSQQYVLIVYILIVDLGILAIVALKNWMWLTLLGMIASYVLILGMDEVPDGELILAQLGLTAIFLVFVGATTLFHILWKRVPRPTDMALMTLNAFFYYATTFGLLWDRYEAWFGLMTLCLSLFYAIVGYAAIKRSGTPPHVALYSIGISLIFLTVAAAVQLGGSWLTVGWAAQAVVLLSIGFVLSLSRLRAFSLGLFTLVALRLAVFDSQIDLDGFALFTNGRFATFVFGISSFYLGAYLYWKYREQIEEWESNISLVLIGAANAFTLWAFTAEAITYFNAFQLNVAVDLPLALTSLWGIYGFGIVAVALRLRSEIFQKAGLALITIAAVKLVFVDTFSVDLDPNTFSVILNWHFLTYLVVLVALLLSAYLYSRQRGKWSAEQGYAFTGIIVVANVVTFWVLNAEAIRFFDAMGIREGADFIDAKQLTLTILWTLYGMCIIAFGIARGSSKIRLSGIGLIGAAVLKLFLLDVFLLEQGFRVVGFVTLGVLLIVTGLAYHRYSDSIRGFLFGKSS